MKGIPDHGPRAAIDLDSVIKTYRRYASVYDLVFGPLMRWGRARVVERINGLDSASVLEVGVGTGLTLSHYRRDKRIVGVDISTEMLSVARRRVETEGLKNVTGLAEMDAESLAFRDRQFDAVVAIYVMSAVPNPQRCLAEMQRVCRAGGVILICNHFVGKKDKWVAQRFEPFSARLGWRPDFALTELLENSSLKVNSNVPVPPFGLFRLVELRNV